MKRKQESVAAVEWVDYFTGSECWFEARIFQWETSMCQISFPVSKAWEINFKKWRFPSVSGFTSLVKYVRKVIENFEFFWVKKCRKNLNDNFFLCRLCDVKKKIWKLQEDKIKISAFCFFRSIFSFWGKLVENFHMWKKFY